MFLSYAPNFAQAKPALNRLLMSITSPKSPETEEEAARETKSLPLTDSGACVEFHSVNFTYASQQRPVLRNFSISIPAGSYVAFVGPSGCGKTSVLSLLQRFYTPSSGNITIDGIDLASIPISEFRAACALVSQDPALFSGTIRENLTLGLSIPDITQQDIEAACRGAEIHDFIATLPDGYDSLLSGSLNASMSGGQKQRMCIARAILRRPKLLLLDEATSSLDSKNESAVQRAIERMAGVGKLTIIAVAHRLATVQNADCIFVLDVNGRIVEEGKHVDLIERKGGVYWQMCEAQALLN